MGKLQEMKLHRIGNTIRRFIPIAASCLLLTFLLATDLHAGKRYTITATAGTGGTISPSGSVGVNSGNNVTFTITPNTGYHIADVVVDGVSQGAIPSYTFVAVTANHTIAASFAINTYTIAVTAGSGGAVTPGTVTVNHGASQTFAITPNAGYQVVNVTVDGVSQGAITSYSFTNVSTSHTLAATFASNSYTITATAGSGGYVSPASATVGYGGSQTFTITPNTGYHVAFVLVDGVSQGAISSYTFNNVTAPHTIKAAFAPDGASPSSTSANYFYDELGRLTRVVTDTVGAAYQYDELGNLLQVTNSTTTSGSPVITGITPNILSLGTVQTVIISGQNLLATESVTATSGLVGISNVTVISDSQISVQMTALSIGTDTIRVTSRNGTPNTAEITIPVSIIRLTPGQLAITPGASGTITISVSPPPAAPMAITLYDSDPLVANIPSSITIPESGSASFTVNGLQLGVATISAGVQSVIFVTEPFSGEVKGLTAGGVSVYFEAPSTSTALPMASPVSVYKEAPAEPSPTAAKPVSVSVEAQQGSSPTVSGGVSVQFQ